MIEQLIQRWGQLAARERKLLMLAVALAVVALVHLGLVEPAWQGRNAIEARLPLLRQQVAEADVLVTEARTLSAAASASARPSLPAVRLRLEQTLEAAGLHGALQQIQASDTLIDLRLRDIGFSAWLNWLEPVLRETRLRVADLSIIRESEPGRVTVRMVLELAGSERR